MSNLIRSPLLTTFTRDLSSKLLLVRHGESIFQKRHRSIAHLKNKNHNEFMKLKHEIQYDPELCDCEISALGQEECYNAGRRLEQFNIKYIFVSPVWRALQSCEYILKGYFHNNGKKHPEVIVNPLIFEKIEDNCDIVPNIYRNMDEFDDYNWEEFEKIPFLPIYMLKYCDTIIDLKNDEIKLSRDTPYYNLCLNYFKKNLKYNHEEVLLKAMEELDKKNVFIESSIKTYDRLFEFKLYLKRFLEENKLKNDEKILLVGHSIVFKHFFTKMIYENSFDPVENKDNYIHLENAEIASVYFEDYAMFKGLQLL